MAKKDDVQKTLESYNDVFADIVNVLLFDGKRVIKEKDLTDAQKSSYYKMADGEVHGQERDVAKYWNNGEIRLSFIGLENQSATEKDMPIRVMHYDAAAYKAQLVDKAEKTCYPVVTLVLYFGTERHWLKNRSLKEIVRVPPELEPFVSDYKINVIELAWLTDEQIKLFRSDFREVVQLLRCMRLNQPFTGSERKVRHVMEIFDLFRVMTKDDNAFDTMKPVLVQMAGSKNKGEEKMYDYFSKKMEADIEKGEKAVTTLFSKLRASGKNDELDRALADHEYLKKLMEEYGVSPAVHA